MTETKDKINSLVSIIKVEPEEFEVIKADAITVDDIIKFKEIM